MMKYALYATVCKRCGILIYSSNRSVHGADNAHKKYSGICSDCITKTEQTEMKSEIQNSILRSLA